MPSAPRIAVLVQKVTAKSVGLSQKVAVKNDDLLQKVAAKSVSLQRKVAVKNAIK